MARLAPRRVERDLRRREPERRREEDEEGFEEHMDEHGVIGLDEGLVAVCGRPRGSRLTGVRSFGCRELQELGQEAAGADGEDTGSPTPGDVEDPGDGTAAELARWHPRQDATGEEEERGSSGAEETPEGTSGAESDGDLYAELSYEGQCGSACSGSPEAPRDGRAPHSPRASLLSSSTDGGDTSALWDISPSPSPPRGRAPGPAGESGRCNRSLPLHVSEPEPCGESSGEEAPAAELRGGTSAAGPVAARGLRGARRPLNHPLPDLSKVEARVRFARGYRPPRGRVPPAAGPALRPSPAEVVREALRSSPRQRPAPAAGRPRPFACPREATELVQQLEDDYHKLLTKYAEAENTIDQLRLGAKVSLYADPPRPSHSVHVGTLGTSSKVMAFSIPRVKTAAISTAPVPALQPSLCGEPAQGPVHQGTSPRPGSPPFPAMGCSACPGECGCQGQHPCPRTRLTQTLAGQTRKFQAQVESFEAWVRAGMSTPQEQLQRFRKLKDTQDALERTYLQAREENRGLQQHPDASGEFDPDRVVEGEIFCLGLRLEELKDRLERAARGRRCLRSCSESASSRGPSLGPLDGSCSSSPAPLLRAPTPAGGSPCPESPALQEMLPSSRPGTGVSSASGESDAGEEEPPQPLWHKRLQVEEDFGDLLEQYKHFKSLPESLSLEQLSLGGSQSPEEVDGLVAGELGKVPCRTPSPEESSDLHTSPSGTAVGPGASSEVSRACVSPRLSQLLPPVQEQRMVSPETDSGFVGSEASRVSPLMPVPEQRSPHAGYGSSHTDSAPEERSRGSCHSHPPGKSRGPAGPATTTLSPDRAHRDLLGSRMERDRAIRALQDEVSRLQRRLEESLHRPRSHPGGRAPLQTARARSQTVGNGLSPEDPAPSEALSTTARSRPAPATRGRSASLPRDAPELLLQSDRSPGRPPEAAPSPRKSPRSPPDTVTVRGRHTAERGSDAAASPASRGGSKAETLEQPGLWYLAASPAAAAVGYLAPVPVVPYPPSVLYCSPAVSTSAPVLAGLPPHPAAGYRLAERVAQAPRQRAASRRLTLDLDDLEELNWSLSRAVEAAKSVKFTTKQMSRSLTSELSRVRDLRGSCLF
ncbi:microtubule organization protein AKNA [Eudromia elegans]